jgi:anti-sigma factor (TIGR02949 family)
MSDLTPNEACDHALQRLYEFHDHALTDAEADEIRQHLLACEPCLDRYDVEEALRLLIRRCCSGQSAPEGLRLRIRTTITRTVIVRDSQAGG